ncbi:hypothetical protein VCUG_02351, partial [Vavraia culicis subsp. floridensis]
MNQQYVKDLLGSSKYDEALEYLHGVLGRYEKQEGDVESDKENPPREDRNRDRDWNEYGEADEKHGGSRRCTRKAEYMERKERVKEEDYMRATKEEHVNMDDRQDSTDEQNDTLTTISAIHALLGAIYLKKNDNHHAVAHSTRSIQTLDQPLALSTLTSAYINLSDYHSALRYCKRYGRVINDFEAKCRCAALCIMVGDYEWLGGLVREMGQDYVDMWVRMKCDEQGMNEEMEEWECENVCALDDGVRRDDVFLVEVVNEVPGDEEGGCMRSEKYTRMSDEGDSKVHEMVARTGPDNASCDKMNGDTAYGRTVHGADHSELLNETIPYGQVSTDGTAMTMNRRTVLSMCTLRLNTLDPTPETDREYFMDLYADQLGNGLFVQAINTLQKIYSLGEPALLVPHLIKTEQTAVLKMVLRTHKCTCIQNSVVKILSRIACNQKRSKYEMILFMLVNGRTEMVDELLYVVEEYIEGDGGDECGCETDE